MGCNPTARQTFSPGTWLVISQPLRVPPAERSRLRAVCTHMASATKNMKRTLREVKHARPGHRFQEYHDRTKRSNSKGSPLARAVRISLAMVAFTLGAVLVVIPGPAIPFFFLAAALLATESRLVARFMDWSEV